MPRAMQAFLREHRTELLERWERMVRENLPSESSLTREQLRDSLPLFLDEIVEGLEGLSGKLVAEQRSALARVHGGQRQHLGRNIAELVREYGLFYETVAELWSELQTDPTATGLLELSKCLFTGAAEAVEEFAEREEADRRKQDLRHFSFIAHELRNPLGTALMMWNTLRCEPALSERHKGVMDRSLSRVTHLVDETLFKARLADLGRDPVVQIEDVDVTRLLAEAEEDSSGDAELKGVALSVGDGSRKHARGDHRLLLSALTNLVRNAVKFTHPGGNVVLRARDEEGRVLIEVQDQCGGLPPGRAERLFEAFTQANQNRRGFGLGLAIAKQAVEAQGGTLSVKDVPDSGCIFVMDLASAP